jgi:galactose-6-phosphate isomerase
VPTLDLSDAFDPEFIDDFVVIRLTETINTHGRNDLTEKAMSAQGVVVPTSPDDLNRLPEGSYMGKSITIITQFRIQGPAKDEVGAITQPDEILWHGSRFVVRMLDDYSGFGAGFVSAVAVSIDSVDPPPIPAPLGSA